MSVSYSAVQWNHHKRVYDIAVACGILGYLGFFVAGSLWLRGPAGPDAMVLAVRALGTCGIVMLHIVLAIGPLCRLDQRFLPLLYNRRHLGVATFLVGLAHAGLSVLYYHGFGTVGPLVSLLSSNPRIGSFTQFPFEWLGAAALTILFLMAATSHDFWLKNLSPRAWKSLHMLVYVAYALLVMHVALGALQSEPSPVFPALLGAGALMLTSLHLAAGWRERCRNTAFTSTSVQADWIDAGSVDDIPDSRARVVCPPVGERIAVFRDGARLCAVANVCAHQGGPLGEGKIVDGCITCPWHGYQYLPANGQSPPPFTEKIPTYRVRIEARRVLVDPRPLPPGTAVEPAIIPGAADA
jgi:sulfoxide reductase heme-binding subunit YedZ